MNTDPLHGPLQSITAFASADTVQAEFETAQALHQTGKLDEAELIYKAILQRQPNYSDALHYLGVAQAQRQRFAEAADLMRRAVEIDPDNGAAHSNRGNVLKALNRHEDALASYDRALALNPDSAEALNNRGAVLSDLGRHDEALVSYGNALAITPGYAEALFNRGVALVALSRHQKALESFDSALAARPDYPEALYNRGCMFRDMGLHLKAEQDFSQLLELAPNFEYALGNKLSSLSHICSWGEYLAAREHCIHAVRGGKRACVPFVFLINSGVGADHLTCARAFTAHKYPPSSKPLWSGERYQHDRIRVAYLSADLRFHATAYLMAELFEKHDRNRFEVSAWSFGPNVEDDMCKRLRQSFEQFNDVRRNTDIEVANMLRTQEVDIAIDLKGYTQHCRPAIFTHRAVPIQVNYLGYPGTMGADYMDYIIGDAVITPEKHEAFYAEKVVRLPDTYQVNDSKRVIAEHTPTRAEVKLPDSGFVFCCFNNNFKIMPEVFDVWMRLLKRVAGSVLWLLEDNAEASRNLRLEAEARGVHADRLVFAARVLPPDHLARHRLADLFLDTLPCNAHTTASDALWAGLPLLTCMSNAFPGRVAASLLYAIGLPEMVTENLADYEALAFRLATNPEMLNDLKDKLARNRSIQPLFDIDRFRRHIESAYITMYERYQRGEPPASFSVPAINS